MTDQKSYEGFFWCNDCMKLLSEQDLSYKITATPS